MYRIGIFSKITGMSIKTLRYYDEIELLKPTSVDEETGYRFYDEIAYEKAMKIKVFKNFEFSIQEMMEAIPRIEDDGDMAAFLKEKHLQLEQKIISTKNLQKTIEAQIKSMKEAIKMNENYEIKIKEIPDMKIASVRYKGRYDGIGKYIGILFKNVGGSALSAPFALYYDEDYKEEDADIEVALEVKKDVNKEEVTTRILPGGKFVSIIHIGPYDKISNSYKAITNYMIENNLKGQTPSREIYKKGPGMLLKGNPEKYETELMIQIG